MSWVLDAARRLLLETPLCDRCLGRMFARLGYGWTNRERGDAIKRLLVMEVHRRTLEGGGQLAEVDLQLLNNIGDQALPLLRLLAPGSAPTSRASCAICGGTLDEFIEKAARDALKLLRAFDVKKFVVGARVDPRILRLEDELKSKIMLPYGESLKAELRREIGKLIQSEDPTLQAEFDEPEATVIVEFPSGRLDIQVNSLMIKGRYWKLARMISQAYWPSPTGPRYFSVEQAAWGLLSATGGERLVVHAAGREDVDARMLGTGRPLIVEVKAPRRRHLPMSLLEEKANSTGRGLVEFKFESIASRRDVRLYKEETARLTKTYRALILSRNRPLGAGDIELLTSIFRNRRILQRTPRRVLHRRPDILRARTVYEVACRSVTSHLIECLIRAEGGLYIKELVSGDAGRTNPSFASEIGADLVCIELDVVAVEGGPLRLFYQADSPAHSRVELRDGKSSKGIPPQDQEAPPEAHPREGSYPQAERDTEGVQGWREGGD